MSIIDNEKSLIQILQEVKQFLDVNKNIKGAVSLMNKVQTQLNKLLKDDQEDEYINLTMSISPQNPIQAVFGSNSLKVKKIQALYDMFILEYNFLTESYYILPYNLHGQDSKKHQSAINNDRSALLNLLIGKTKSHIKPLEKTESMTQLHRLISNIPPCKPVLIMPNYSGQNLDGGDKYFYIYEQNLCAEKKQQHYIVDRYYIFSTYGLAYKNISSITREVRKRIFQARLLKTDDPENINYQFIENCLTDTLYDIYNDVRFKPISLDGNNQNQQYGPILEIDEKQIKYKASYLSNSKLCRLSLLLFYSAVTSRKIILYITKDRKHYLTDAILALEMCLKPMKYIFPVVFASLTEDHCEYLESPVPIIVGLWGSDKKITNQIKNIQKQWSLMKLKNSMASSLGSTVPELIIDMENYVVPGIISFETEDLFVLEKLSQYLNKYGKGKSLSDKLNKFVNDLLQQQEPKKKSQWMSILYRKIKNSDLYNVYIQKPKI